MTIFTEDRVATLHALLNDSAVKIGEQRLRIAKLEAQVAKLSKPEWFNQWDDPEYSYDDPSDAGENIGGDEVMRLIGSRSVCDVWVTHRALTLDENGQVDEDEIAEFNNEADAIKCWDDSIAALRAKSKTGEIA